MKKTNEDEIENEIAPVEEDLGKAETEKSGITLSQIGHMIWKHWVAALVCLLVGLAGGVGYSKFLKTPKYQATVQLAVVENSSDSTTDNITLALRKTQIAYGYMTSDEIVTKLGEKLGAKDYDVYLKDKDGKKKDEIDVSKVKGYYTVAIPTVTTNNTSIFLTVTSTCKTEQMAIDVANFTVEATIECANASENIKGLLKNSIVSMGNANSAKDTSTSTLVFAAVGALAGLVIGAAYGIVRELLNSKVSSKVDLETITGYKVIGMIPKYENAPEKKEESKGGKDNA